MPRLGEVGTAVWLAAVWAAPLVGNTFPRELIASQAPPASRSIGSTR